MAFGKKKDDAPTPDADGADDAVDTAAPEGVAAEGEAPTLENGPLAPSEAGAAIAEESAAVEAAAPAPAAAPNSDALLSMFQETKSAVDDLAVLVDLAGETDLDDILEELRTLRAALGITDAYDEEADFAAAA